MGRAKIINDRGSQSVRLPKSCRFPKGQKEVNVRREGDKIVLEPVPKGEWSQRFLDAIGSLKDEEIEPLPSRHVSHLKDPFE